MALAGLGSSSAAGTPRGATSLLGEVERRIGFTLAGLVLAAVAVGGWALGRTLGGKAPYLLSYGAIALLVAAAVIARRRRPVKATRSELARRARVGQVLDVTLELTADRRVTTFRIEEQLHPHLGTTVFFPVSSIGPGSTVEHRYTITPRLRGVYRVGPLTAEFSDPMGLAKRHQHLIDAAEIIVHPNTEEVLDRPLTRAFEDPPLRPPNSRPWPEGFEFYGMREYVRGDDVRRIIWRAFARTEKLLVREFEQGISDRITVILDTDESWNSPGNPSDTFETAVRVAASVGVRHIRDGLSMRLVANYGELAHNLRGPRARLLYLDELARVRLSREPLSEAFERLVRGGRRDTHVVLVTSHFDAVSAARANLLIAGGASLTVAAIVWEESDPATTHRAHEIGAQVVQIKPGASLGGVFRASLATKASAR